MSAPTEQRPEDVVQAVLVEYRLDQHIARQRATNWGEAA